MTVFGLYAISRSSHHQSSAMMLPVHDHSYNFTLHRFLKVHGGARSFVSRSEQSSVYAVRHSGNVDKKKVQLSCFSFEGVFVKAGRGQFHHTLIARGEKKIGERSVKTMTPRRRSCLNVVACSTALDGAVVGRSDLVVGDGFKLCRGIETDIKRKLPFYWSDFTDGLHPKAAAATFFLYFACLAPCVAFGGLMSSLTGNSIGIVETMLGTAVSGIIYALFAGQPLTLIGPTGLMATFIGLLYKMTDRLMLPFLPVYSWVGIWTFIFLFFLAAAEASNLIRHFSRFTDETFSTLISLGFVHEACKGIQNLFKKTSPFPLESAFFSLVLSLGTWIISTLLSQLRASPLLLRPVRETLSDFGPPLAIIVMSMVPHVFFPSISLPTLFVPATFSTSCGRPWLVPLLSLPKWAIAAATFPAALLSVLVFLDQNITTRLINNPENHLKKGGGYHLDLVVLGALICISSLFGLPWAVASTVPSLSHVRTLATTSQAIHISGDNADAPEEIVFGVQENRVTGIMIHAFIGASLLLLQVLKLVPIPVMNGIFLYMGLRSLADNQFVDRLKLWFYDPDLYPQHDFIESVPKPVLHGFTAIQAACLAALAALKNSPWGIAFPLLILALLPIRRHIAGNLFAPEYLSVLDGH